jgi:hypothetical protein
MCRPAVAWLSMVLCLGALDQPRFGIDGVWAAEGKPDTKEGKEKQKVEEFLKARQKEADRLRGALAEDIKKIRKRVRNSDVDDDTKRIHLEAVDSDLAAVEKEGRLPQCDLLIETAIAHAEKRRNLLEKIEKFRQDQVEAALDEGGEAFAELDRLEARLHEIAGGRDNFRAGATWTGTREGVKGSFRWRLEIDEVKGNGFRGKLDQRSGGSHTRFAVEGKLDGNRLRLATTQVLVGKNNKGGTRGIGAEGYILSDRIVANVGAIDLKGRATSSWVSLWSEGSDPTARRDR